MSWKIREVSKENKENKEIYLIITKLWCCGVYDLMDVITKDPDLKAVRKFHVNILRRIFENCFENLLTPTPEELTLVDREFGDGSADAYLQLLEETKKILD